MDPKGIGTVSLELNNTAAQLLAKLCVDLETEDASGVVSRALGLMDLVMQGKQSGKRLCLEGPDGQLSDVVV